MLDRTIRIRQLVPDYEDQTIEKFVVTGNDGRLHWRNLPLDCKWSMGVNPSPNDLWTAVGALSSTCPDGYENVGIGMYPSSTTGGDRGTKLFVMEDTPDSSPLIVNVAVRGEVLGGEGANIGLQGGAQPTSGDASLENTGVYGAALDGEEENTGVYGWGVARTNATVAFNKGVHGVGLADGGTIGRNYGGYFRATSYAPSNIGVYGEGQGANDPSLTNIGVYGIANYGYYTTSPSTNQNWAGWFAGDVMCTGLYQTSDAAFKQNVENIEDALDLVSQLAPKTYTFNTTDFPAMGFKEGTQYGLIAQEVEVVLPELVVNTTAPEVLDTAGNVLQPRTDLKAINYNGLIPLLIAAVKEQNATITEMQTQMVAMQAQLDGCCTGGQGGGMMAPQGSGGTGIGDPANQRDAQDQLRIQPNPFNEGTTITYTLEAPGNVRLLVSTSAGKQLRVLEDSQRAEGTFTYEWNTTDLASGVYNVMLLVDGAPMVQKAVKIER